MTNRYMHIHMYISQIKLIIDHKHILSSCHLCMTNISKTIIQIDIYIYIYIYISQIEVITDHNHILSSYHLLPFSGYM